MQPLPVLWATIPKFGEGIAICHCCVKFPTFLLIKSGTGSFLFKGRDGETVFLHSTFGDYDGDSESEAAFAGLFVSGVHVEGGFPHGLNDVIEADLGVGRIAGEGDIGGGDGFEGTHRVAFDAGDLHEATDGVACETEVVFHCDFGGHEDAVGFAAEDISVCGSGHSGADADFGHASPHCGGDGGAFFE